MTPQLRRSASVLRAGASTPWRRTGPERRRELGIRVALGADRQHLVRVVMAQAARFVTIGLALGTAIALVAGRFLERLLFGVTVSDLPVYGLVILTLIVAGGLAGLIPAWRATSIPRRQRSRPTSTTARQVRERGLLNGPGPQVADLAGGGGRHRVNNPCWPLVLLALYVFGVVDQTPLNAGAP